MVTPPFTIRIEGPLRLALSRISEDMCMPVSVFVKLAVLETVKELGYISEDVYQHLKNKYIADIKNYRRKTKCVPKNNAIHQQ